MNETIIRSAKIYIKDLFQNDFSGHDYYHSILQGGVVMKIANFTLVIVGLIMILLAVFCPAIIAEVHRVTWRLVIGLLGCFSLVSGIYKMTRNH